MKTALITTTINVPTVLSLYRKLDPDVRFFVACEVEKTTTEQRQFLETVPSLFSVWEGSPKWKCSDLIGWRTIGRRSIALLEALKWGADVIVTIDDDNIPLDAGYFWQFRKHLYEESFFDGIRVDGTGWFDVGALLDPVASHRGFPHDRKQVSSFTSVTGARVGVAAGTCLGDPDVSAATRMVSGPVSHRVSELLRSGIVVDPRRTRTVFNSQNTAFIRELAPCFLMVPAYERYDDIYASLVVQRVMRERDLWVHYGQPFVWQARNAHNPFRDLAAEQWGAEHILEFASWLDGFLGQHDVIGMLRVMATSLPGFIPSGTRELWLAWLDDCERVMK